VEFFIFIIFEPHALFLLQQMTAERNDPMTPKANDGAAQAVSCKRGVELFILHF
jgi:hypothetical protein